MGGPAQRGKKPNALPWGWIGARFILGAEHTAAAALHQAMATWFLLFIFFCCLKFFSPGLPPLVAVDSLDEPPFARQHPRFRHHHFVVLTWTN